MEKYLIVLVIVIILGIFIYSANMWYDRQTGSEIVDNQDYIIQSINESDAQRDANMRTLLSYMNDSIHQNKDDAAANRQYLEALIENQNLTVIIRDEDANVTATTTGKISGLDDGPVIVNMP